MTLTIKKINNQNGNNSLKEKFKNGNQLMIMNEIQQKIK